MERYQAVVSPWSLSLMARSVPRPGRDSHPWGSALMPPAGAAGVKMCAPTLVPKPPPVAHVYKTHAQSMGTHVTVCTARAHASKTRRTETCTLVKHVNAHTCTARGHREHTRVHQADTRKRTGARTVEGTAARGSEQGAAARGAASPSQSGKL